MERDMFLAGDNACGGGGSGARQDENTALFKRRKRRGSPFSLHQSAVGTSTGSSMTLKELLYRELFFLNQQHNSLLEREEIVDATLARLRILEMGEEGQEEGEYQGSPITVVVNNANGEKMSARIKKNTQLKSLLQTYCDREVVRMDRTRFVFRGKTIQPEQTVDELRMKDGSVIDVDALPHHLYPIPPNFDVRELLFSEQVLLQQQLACLLRRAKQVETWLQEVTLKEAGFDTGISHQDQTHRIRIKLTCSGRDDDEMFFDIEKDTQMGRMMQVVYDILGADEEHLAFLFNNQNITAEETPDEIGLEDGDAIAAFITCCPRSCSYRVDGNCQRWKKIKEEISNLFKDMQTERETAVVEVKRGLLKELEGFGFSRARAAWALHYTGNASLEGAVNWIIDHENDSQFDVMPLVEFNIEIESPSLSDDSMEAKQARVLELREHARKKREEEEKKREREREKERIRSGKELLEAKRTAEENERKRNIALRKAEKEEEKKARERILQKLEADRLERKRRLGGLPTEIGSASRSSPAAPPNSSIIPSSSHSSVSKTEQMRECLRSLRRNHKDEDPRVMRKAFETLLVLVRNAAKNPDDEKYRRIRLTNPLFHERVGRFEEGTEFLELCGFKKQKGSDFSYLPRDDVDISRLREAAFQLTSAMANPFFGILSKEETI